MLRVSATELEQYRYYLYNDWLDFPTLVDRLRGVRDETIEMRAGTAFHALLEDASEGREIDHVERDGFYFRLNLDSSLSLPPMREIKTEREYTIGGETVVLVSMADAILGRKVWDHKLTGDFDAENYIDSMQWRTYLTLFDADEFVYNVFEGGEARKTKANALLPGIVWDVDSLHQLTMRRYPGMEDDVLRMLTEFTKFVRQYVPERFDDPVAAAKRLPF